MKTLKLIVSVLILGTVVYAGETSIQGFELSGSVISDYYGVMKTVNNSSGYIVSTLNNVINQQDKTGFQSRRIYLTFEKVLSKNVSTRLRYQMTNDDYMGDKMTPEVKDAYLKWNYSGAQKAYFGISKSATLSNISDFWQYRLLDKTATDFFGIRSSRDFGIALQGELLEKLNYHLFLGNGESNASESDKDKQISLALKYDLPGNFMVEMYGDKKVLNEYYNGSTARMFLGWQNSDFRIGTGFTYQDDIKDGKNRKCVNLISVPAVYNYSKKLSFVSQFAYYDTKFDYTDTGLGPEDYTQSFLLLGLDYQPTENIHVMPNIQYLNFNRENKNLDENNILIGRMTLSYTF